MGLGNGKNIDFWHDVWCGPLSLKDRFPNLYNICFDQECSVHTICKQNWRLYFKRWLSEDLQNQLWDLHNMLFRFKTNDQSDGVIWKWEKSGLFSVKSVYKHLFSNCDGVNNKQLWKAKLPLKIKIFMWLTLQNAILTKDNLLKRKWKGNPACAFCQEEETVKHLMFDCPVIKYVWSILAYIFGATVRPNSFSQFWIWINWCLPEGITAVCWATWKTKNNICFEGKRVKTPTELVYLISSTISYWAGLQKEAMSAQMEYGTEVLKKTALRFHQHERMDGGDNRMAIV